MSERRPFSSELGRLWRNATPAQQTGLAAFAIVCVGLLAVVFALARQPRYTVLYAGLEPEDAAKVVERLRELKVPYRVRNEGALEVPAESVHEVRLDLAAEGLPAGGQTGFEIFDRTQLGLTEFGERMNYQRALQGELARTIAHLDGVERARVHIALPEERLFASDQEEPSASVVLKLRASARAGRSHIRSIVHLVSGAVEGLAPESVAVLDTQGRLLSSPERSPGDGVGLAAASGHLELRRQYERAVETAVQSMLDGVFGPGRSVVRASADICFDRVEEERETYEPASEGLGVLTSRQETRERYEGSGASGPMGIPGVSSNTGTGSSGSKAPPNPDADQYERTETSVQYLVSRSRARTIRPPGRVRQLSLSVFVDEDADFGEGDDVSAAVAAAAGLDSERGDAVVITRVPFQPAPDGEGGGASAVRDFYHRVGRDFVAIVLTALFLWFVRGLLLRRRAASESPEQPVQAPQPDSASAPTEPSPQQQVEIDPERAASVLRTWLASDEVPGGDGGARAGAGSE